MARYLQVFNKNGIIVDDQYNALSLKASTPFYSRIALTKNNSIYAVTAQGVVFHHMLSNKVYGTDEHGESTLKESDYNHTFMIMNDGNRINYAYYRIWWRPRTRNDYPSIVGDSSFRKNHSFSDNPRVLELSSENYSTGRIGLQAFNEQGQCVFDSSRKYMDIIDVIDFEDWNFDINRTYSYPVPIAIAPISMGAYTKLAYGKRVDNNSYAELLCCYQNSRNSFKLLRMKKTGASYIFGSHEGWCKRNTTLLVFNATVAY